MQIRDTILPLVYTQHLTDFQEKIEATLEEQDAIIRAQKAKTIAFTFITELKQLFHSNAITSDTEEIFFFKYVKPVYLSQFIHHHDVLAIEINKPLGDTTIQQTYYQDQAKKIKFFFEDHDSFYRYTRSGYTHKDSIYFTRGHLKDLPLHHLDPMLTQYDETFSTGYDYILSQIHASSLTELYINQTIYKLQHPEHQLVSDSSEQLQWTASIIDFVEFIYMLIADGAINNGKIPTAKLARIFGKLLNIKVEHLPKKMEEIRMRKINRTKFADRSKRSLLRKMEEDDENAL